jgi:hypothetical protein
VRLRSTLSTDELSACLDTRCIFNPCKRSEIESVMCSLRLAAASDLEALVERIVTVTAE